MSTWITLSEADLAAVLTTAQLETLAARPTRPPETDVVVQGLAAATSEIRAAVRSQDESLLSDTPGTIPPDLKALALTRTLISLERGVTGFFLNDQQLEDIEASISELEKVAFGQLVIERADDAPIIEADVSASAIEVTTFRKNRLSAQRLRRL